MEARAQSRPTLLPRTESTHSSSSLRRVKTSSQLYGEVDRLSCYQPGSAISRASAAAANPSGRARRSESDADKPPFSRGGTSNTGAMRRLAHGNECRGHSDGMPFPSSMATNGRWVSNYANLVLICDGWTPAGISARPCQ